METTAIVSSFEVHRYTVINQALRNTTILYAIAPLPFNGVGCDGWLEPGRTFVKMQHGFNLLVPPQVIHAALDAVENIETSLSIDHKVRRSNT
ncbi:hypothetical protein JOY44_30920 (plasmid) [Phormidium sp. CLA17]|uniref:hypothetical protein n=1 Tax=Leptolyngbya sp. Cla-17 TaxID=2803751 RepID=UPI0014923096|nr:hypothetical protein [Leptolyngbya sp. Cla-17]MBM0744746.1 hypothetical protein [Leptolyngbya sp. Cla-17]MBM0744749.1 hypothetical protein [Leptolyngbya sp. Cla-17]MBM0745136.1 hypothetical protein [Leptolyngbya sp. Cla-17]MBM0745138.1 hypothetical protein [Leptolyngbya sp. Cla-17]MBM0745788.1 hypothetical protein [Leptolyngbya sp. Cla-17]